MGELSGPVALQSRQKLQRMHCARMFGNHHRTAAFRRTYAAATAPRNFPVRGLSNHSLSPAPVCRAPLGGRRALDGHTDRREAITGNGIKDRGTLVFSRVPLAGRCASCRF
jgi:hypothetical protein